MTILTVMSFARANDERLNASMYAGLYAALVSLPLLWFLDGRPVMSAFLGILIGAAPVVGYDVARGVFCAEKRLIIAGLIGYTPFATSILFLNEDRASVYMVRALFNLLPFILWPIVVGAISKNQSMGRLLGASLIGVILGTIVTLVAMSAFGGDPYFDSGILVFLIFSIWGGTVAAALSAWSKSTTDRDAV